MPQGSQVIAPAPDEDIKSSFKAALIFGVLMNIICIKQKFDNTS